MNSKRLLVVFAAVIAYVMAVTAQIVDPVKWTVEVKADDATSGSIVWTADIEQGYHIYGMRQVKDGPVATSFTVQPVDGLQLDGDVTPSKAATEYTDRMFDLNLQQWSGTVQFSQRYTLDPGVRDLTVQTQVRYMACRDNSCTAPKTVDLSCVIGVGTNATRDTVPAETVADSRLSSGVSDSEAAMSRWWAPVEADNIGITGNTASHSMWMLLVMGFLGGLLALLTPCVWPMIPMTLSFFLKKNRSRGRAIGEAVLYGLSIVVIFLVLGIAMTLIFGAGKLNEIATSAVFNLIFFALLVIFAISFFGAFDIKLPSGWSNAADGKANSTSGILSIFFMAFTLVLVSFSCTGPIIGTLLVEAAANDSILGPATGMGGFALGLALPFTLFAFFPWLLKEMPKAGGWMNSVKVVLGFIELILSLKFLSVADLAYGWRILDREVFVAIWIVLFVLLGLYLLGKLRFAHDTKTGHTTVLGFFLAVVSFSFAVYLVPGLWGAPLKAVSAFAPPLYTQDFNLYHDATREFADYDEGMLYAAQKKLPVMVDFSGHACVNCRKMEGAVFDTPQVRQILGKDYVMIKLMVDDKEKLEQPYTVTENGKKVKINTVGDRWSYLQRHKFNINSQPYYVLLDNDGHLIAPPRAYDENVEAFTGWLEQGKRNYKDEQTVH